VGAERILSVDLGTSSLKAVIYTTEMYPVAISRRRYNDQGDARDAEEWWVAFLDALAELSEGTDFRSIAVIVFSGYNAMIGVDKYDNAVTPVIHYYSDEALNLVKRRYNAEDDDYIFRRAGNPLFYNGMMAHSILWQKSLGLYDDCDCFLYSSGYLAFRLTGKRSIDTTRASLSLLHDNFGANLTWDPDLCKFFGVDQSKLPEIYQPWDIVGGLMQRAASETGLLSGIPVIIGGVDSSCASLGAGMMEQNQAMDVGGSAGGLSMLVSERHPNKGMLTKRSFFQGLWTGSFPLNAYSKLFIWFLSNLAPQWSSEQLMDHIGKATPGCGGLHFLPFINGSRFPYNSSGTRGHFANLTMEHNIGDMARAVAEGLALSCRLMLREISKMGHEPTEIVAVGGDGQNPVWSQVRADVMQKAYTIPDIVESSAYGAAVLGAYGAGIIKDIREFIVKRVVTTDRYHPNRELAATYQQKFSEFIALCNRIYYSEMVTL